MFRSCIFFNSLEKRIRVLLHTTQMDGYYKYAGLCSGICFTFDIFGDSILLVVTVNIILTSLNFMLVLIFIRYIFLTRTLAHLLALFIRSFIRSFGSPFDNTLPYRLSSHSVSYLLSFFFLYFYLSISLALH